MTGAASSAVFATALQVNMTPQTVQTRTSSTLNNYGEATFTGDATTFDCYIERVLSQPAGINADIEVEYKVFIPSQTLTIDTGDQITLPAPVSGTRPIVAVETLADPLGQVGQIVYVGRINR
tara:strand:- start:1035 stop:1400 length:366 start_codon:yes stop_codon:yes gene_type:complete